MEKIGHICCSLIKGYFTKLMVSAFFRDVEKVYVYRQFYRL
ncbi:hypothetical protein B4147_4528 [Bacillus wiedmannii]|uniref:Uncharacterized protein n=1 Tax=Bacillus wiedmannii TaxID=1890302 RepID=A0A0G8CL48_9BACI|nr:hypothetical protein B4147_4528 [Bacillus wiedmannii]